MSTAKKLQRISVEDYLAGELVAPVKHEYLGGEVYAMAGARNLHNMIAGNIYHAARNRLRGKPCRPFNSDTKVRIRGLAQVRFYYPDTSIVCEPNPVRDSFQDNPVVLFEVLSKDTRRIDTGEKKDAYLSIPSLKVYALVEQEMAAIAVYRRTESSIVNELYQGLDAVLVLGEIGLSLPLTEIYEDVEFMPEEDDSPAAS